MSFEIATAPPSTRVRLGVLLLLCSLSLVLYMDRVCMSQAVDPIKREFGLDNVQISYVLNAFLLAYALFEMPTGRWGDRFGSRRVLTRIVVWWSVFTVLTGACNGLISLMAVRFLFGAGEAGAYPNAARVIRRWFPPHERGRVQGLLLASAGVGAVLSQVVAGYLIELVGWRWSFAIFGTTGFVWVAAFWLWFREDPAEHPRIGEAELRLLAAATDAAETRTHEPIPWANVLSNPNIWLLGMITASSAFCSYLYYSWYPTYMKEGRGVSTSTAGWISGSVLAGGVIGLLIGGMLADWFVRTSAARPRARQQFGLYSKLIASLLLVAAVQSSSPWTMCGLTSASCLIMSTQNAIWWSTATEISGRHIGSLFGLLNSLGVIGGFCSQYFFGALADFRAAQGYTGREQWDPAFYAYAVILFFGGCCWWFINPDKKVSESSRAD